jgi:putative geranylgeranyl diphosphate synthase
MKKMVLFLLIMTMAFVSYSAKKTKITSKVYTGEYVKSTNTFTYKKDNLVFKDKTLYYQLNDNSGTLDLVYNSIGQNYGVTDEDIITLTVSGRVSNGILTVDRIINYRIPEYKLPVNTFELGN